MFMVSGLVSSYGLILSFGQPNNINHWLIWIVIIETLLHQISWTLAHKGHRKSPEHLLIQILPWMLLEWATKSL